MKLVSEESFSLGEPPMRVRRDNIRSCTRRVVTQTGARSMIDREFWWYYCCCRCYCMTTESRRPWYFTRKKDTSLLYPWWVPESQAQPINNNSSVDSAEVSRSVSVLVALRSWLRLHVWYILLYIRCGPHFDIIFVLNVQVYDIQKFYQYTAVCVCMLSSHLLLCFEVVGNVGWNSNTTAVVRFSNFHLATSVHPPLSTRGYQEISICFQMLYSLLGTHTRTVPDVPESSPWILETLNRWMEINIGSIREPNKSIVQV